MKYLAILSLSLLLSCSTSNKFSKEVIIVPDDYQGHVYIFYDQDYTKGNVEKNLFGHVTIFIPNDGVVFTKFTPKSTITIRMMSRCEYKLGKTCNKFNALGGGKGRIYNPKEIIYSNYYIGEFENKNLDSLMNYGKNHEYIKATYLKYYKL